MYEETMAEIKEQYPALVSHELQLLASAYVHKWPRYLNDFKYDTISIYLENNIKGILETNHWGPKKLRILAAKFGLDLYPELDAFSTGINQTMDNHAHMAGLYNWSCISPDSNTVWLRKDGLIVHSVAPKLIEIDMFGGYITQLRRIEKEHPSN